MKNFDKSSRRTAQERRDFQNDVASELLERRRNPDRRLEGLDVQIIDLTEAAFKEFIDQSIYKK